MTGVNVFLTKPPPLKQLRVLLQNLPYPGRKSNVSCLIIYNELRLASSIPVY